MKNHTTQSEFFQKLDTEKYHKYENNLCGIINVFLVLKELGGNVTEVEVFERGIHLHAYDSFSGWEYDKLIEVMEYFLIREKIDYSDVSIFDTKIFHKKKLQKVLLNLGKNIYIASIKVSENHLIIIDKVDGNTIYYTTAGTMGLESAQNKTIKMDDFFDVYNGRGILVEL